MKTVKLSLQLNIPDDALVLDVTALMAAWRYVLRGFFPGATMTTEMPCPPKGTTTNRPTLLS